MADGDGETDVLDLSGNGKGIALNVFPIPRTDPNITVSTVPPPDPQVGDLWVDTN